MTPNSMGDIEVPIIIQGNTKTKKQSKLNNQISNIFWRLGIRKSKYVMKELKKQEEILEFAFSGDILKSMRQKHFDCLRGINLRGACEF